MKEFGTLFFAMCLLVGCSSISGTPEALLSAINLTFADTAVGSISSSDTVILENHGTAPLHISIMDVSGDFAETNDCGSTVLAGTSCKITVTFKPTSTGPLTGTVSVTDNATGSPQTISLSGNGVTTPPVRSTCQTGGMICGNQYVCCAGLTCTFNGDRATCQ